MELNKLVAQLDVLEDRAKMTASTVKFLSGEADKLMRKSENLITEGRFEEFEEVQKQMDAMYLRIQKEKEILMADMVKLSEFSEKFKHLQSLPIED